MLLTRRTLLAAATAAVALAAGGAYWLAGMSPAAAGEVTVYKSPTCGCCGSWVEHLRQHGFTVAVEEHDDLTPIKQRLDVPVALQACHTAVIGDYLIEGHVPAADIRRLLAERPQAKGLAVPGMPIGSPGMEQGTRREPYAVILLGTGGQQSVWSRY